MSIAIIGSGVAGLGAAYSLNSRFSLTVYESGDHVGGHTNTVSITEGEKEFPVDTGFMVFNKVTYPNLTRLFDVLKVPVQKTDMSFSVQQKSIGLEYAGASWSRLFGQKSNLLNFRFWKMLLQLDRFNKEAVSAIDDPTYESMTLRDYVAQKKYGDDFLNLYVIPMAGSVWSTPAEKMLEFPATTLLRFFYNHGFLGMDTQHQWWTVTGGAKVYVEKLMASFAEPLAIVGGAKKVSRVEDKVLVVSDDGSEIFYDKVVFACHANQVLKILSDSTQTEAALLDKFSYQSNITQVHTDSSVMPSERACWSSWNYRIAGDSTSTHYWMNSLQKLPTKKDYFVSLNALDFVAPDSVIKTIEYEHPLFSLAAINAQKELNLLNKAPGRNLFFCGSYMKYGFHEDAFSSGLDVGEILNGEKIWQ